MVKRIKTRKGGSGSFDTPQHKFAEKSSKYLGEAGHLFKRHFPRMAWSSADTNTLKEWEQNMGNDINGILNKPTYTPKHDDLILDSSDKEIRLLFLEDEKKRAAAKDFIAQNLSKSTDPPEMLKRKNKIASNFLLQIRNFQTKGNLAKDEVERLRKRAAADHTSGSEFRPGGSLKKGKYKRRKTKRKPRKPRKLNRTKRKPRRSKKISKRVSKKR